MDKQRLFQATRFILLSCTMLAMSETSVAMMSRLKGLPGRLFTGTKRLISKPLVLGVVGGSGTAYGLYCASQHSGVASHPAANQSTTDTAVRLVGRSFGTEVQNYTNGRKPHSEEIFKFIKELSPTTSAILDLGCGNGRGTLGLCKAGFTDVVGYDIDADMLAEAKRRATASGHSVTFIHDRVANLTKYFTKGSRSLVTAFSALHWFASPEEVAAINSIMTPQGLFVVVAGSDREPNVFKKACQALIEKESGHPIIKNDKKGSKLVDVLKNGQFKILTVKTFAENQTYNGQQFKDMMRSNSSWAELSAKEKERIWPVLEKFIDTELNGKPLTVRVEQLCIVAQKA